MRRSSRLGENSQKAAKEKDFLRKVEEQSIEGLAIINAKEKGRGVAAARVFSIGEYVTCYKGELIFHKEAIKRYITLTLNLALGLFEVCFLTRILPI